MMLAFCKERRIDRFGNLNTTVIGDYEKPSVVAGSGGAV